MKKALLTMTMALFLFGSTEASLGAGLNSIDLGWLASNIVSGWSKISSSYSYLWPELNRTAIKLKLLLKS